MMMMFSHRIRHIVQQGITAGTSSPNRSNLMCGGMQSLLTMTSSPLHTTVASFSSATTASTRRCMTKNMMMTRVLPSPGARRFAHMERAGKCVRPGLVIMLPGSDAPIPHRVVKFVHGKRGKGGGFVRSTLKNLVTGQVYEKTFTADENLTIGELEKFAAQYSWNDGSTYYFIQNRTFDEIKIAAEDVDCIDFLYEGVECNLSINDGQVLAVEMPLTCEFVVTATENTDHGKRAKIANVVISVPEFVEVGDKIKVNTVEKEYLAKIL